MRQVFALHTLATLTAATTKKAPEDFHQQVLHWFDERPSNQRFL